MRRLAGQHALVVGPGWLGAPLAVALAAEQMRVWTVQRHAREETAPSITALSGDIRDPDPTAPWRRALPSRIDHVVVCIAPNMSAGDGYADTYPAATAGAVALAAHHGARSLVYTSSTGVYGRTDGGACHETDVIAIQDARQGALRRAEERLTEGPGTAALGCTVLRVAGLYGPGRDPAPRFRKRTTDAADPWCNMAWRDDVIRAIIGQLTAPPASGTSRLLNCADGTPLRASTIARALGATDAQPEAVERRPAPTNRSNQRISTRALQDTGWSPQMPTVLHGLSALGHTVDWTVLNDSAA